MRQKVNYVANPYIRRNADYSNRKVNAFMWEAAELNIDFKALRGAD